MSINKALLDQFEAEEAQLAGRMEAEPAGGAPPVENVDFVETTPFEGAKSTKSTKSTPPPPRQQKAVYPKDSVLYDYIQFGRRYTESEDHIILGSLLPMVAGMLGDRCWIDFAGRKFPNLFSFVVTNPGQRKSTTINLAQKLAYEILGNDVLISGQMSEQALFKAYQANCERIYCEDEGNTVLSNWASDAAGKLVSKRFLKLYDCGPWTETYQKHANDSDDRKVMQVIPEPVTSLLIGVTFNACRLNGIESRDGLRRRIAYYVSENSARIIEWPESIQGNGFCEICRKFEPIAELKGEFHLSKDARELWSKLQAENRKQGQRPGITEIEAAALSESPSRTLKIAMLFEVCRWARTQEGDLFVIREDTLAMAAEHEAECIRASGFLDHIAKKAEIEDRTEKILATIRSKFKADEKGKITLSRTQITHTVNPNPNRGGTTTEDLYNLYIPELIQQGNCRLARKEGKAEVYEFSSDPSEGGPGKA